MASKKGISQARLKRIYQRQSNPNWDHTYIPSILATPQEAPSISRAFILTPSKLGGRETHLLSTGERNAALLGLYHPDVVGLQEQRMLSPEPTVHPLWTMLGGDGIRLPAVKGVIDVAERLGYLKLLPRLRVTHPQKPEETLIVIFPWIGDLLWAIRTAEGKVYCINWSVKDKEADFTRPGPSRDGRLVFPTESQQILARHEIERIYYADAGIRSLLIASEGIDRHVIANLRHLFLYHRRDLVLTFEQEAEIYDKFVAAFEVEIPPSEVILNFVMRGRYSAELCKTVLYQAIWERRLRVDLFQPILVNRPLKPESVDVIRHYQDWFKEAG
jgi:hypothetical protein